MLFLTILSFIALLAVGCANDTTPPGPHKVIGPLSVMLYDTKRNRHLEVVFWHPEALADESPLVVYAHGFDGDPEDSTWLTNHLASQGYVVAAPRFPGTNADLSSDHLQLNDVINQPADVSRAIDLALGDVPGAPADLAGKIDAQRIALIGRSLGGLTTYLAGYDPELMEPRLTAAVGLAPGAGDIFYPPFYAHRDLPLLIIHGDKDMLVDYPATSARSHARSSAPRVLAKLVGGTHMGFADFPWLGFNPDAMFCTFFGSTFDQDPADITFHSELARRQPDSGVGDYTDSPPCTFDVPEVATMSIPRQHALSKALINSFLATQLRDAPLDQYQAGTRQLAADNADLEIAVAL
ncbi:hypothetical protein A3709_09095 [Halioglobus sp. HI00S01]|nr:hypothetical protein A3709_09095 [Halioglobus sp. HI00S01]